jgi:hypothetical protein
MAAIDIKLISSAILEQKAGWIATETDLLKLGEADRQARLGVTVDAVRLAAIKAALAPDIAAVIAHFETALKISPIAQEAAPAATPADVPAPAVKAVQSRLAALPIIHPIPIPIPPFHPLFLGVDWRNRNGRDNVSPVKDQGGCGSCVSFGTTGALESMVIVEHDVTLDLSEAELIFCGGGSCGGWWPDNAITYVKGSGVSQESCFPYQAHNMPCVTCSGRAGEAIQVANSVVVNAVADRKHYLWNVGPMIAVFQVFDDFFGYSSGVYSHVTGSLAGLHCVEVVGYDDFAGCWICKNSWGSSWGDQGFFKIAYGQCEIDSQFPFWGIYGTRWFNT